MKITECGKYKTRAGSTAVVNTICSLGTYPMRGYIERGGTREPCSWTDHGGVSCVLLSPSDLVEKVFEITETGVYRTRDGRLVEVVELEGGLAPDYPIRGGLEGEGFFWTWALDGTYTHLTQGYECRDIVAKAKAKAKAEAPEPEQSALPAWAFEAYTIDTPDTDTEIRDGYIAIDKMDQSEAHRDTHYVDCHIDVEAQEHDEHIFESCVFDGCVFEGNQSLLAHGFKGCKMVGTTTFSSTDGVLDIEIRG